MPRQTVRLGEAASRGVAALRRAIEKSPARTRPVQVRLAKGERPVGAGEVLVMVFGPEGGVASRTTVRGREVDLGELLLHLAGAEVAVESMAANSPAANAPQLTAGEALVLDEAGFGNSGGAVPGALERSRIVLELLLRQGSLSLEEAARALHVGTSRLRQRLSPDVRTIYGIKDGRSWRIPRFQIIRGQLVRGIDKVLPHIRADAHPLAVKTWFCSPHQDLVAGAGEQPVTPIAWLAAGHSPEQVAALAEEI